MIETAPRGRAKCRTCKQAILKGVLRFAEETENAFDPDCGTTQYFYHLFSWKNGFLLDFYVRKGRLGRQNIKHFLFWRGLMLSATAFWMEFHMVNVVRSAIEDMFL